MTLASKDITVKEMNRVTRLGEVSPIEQLFSIGQVF
jgi:hypothetical protein